MGSIVELNGLCYCELHVREICHECTLDMQMVNEIAAFQMPESGCAEYPDVYLSNPQDSQCKHLLAARWLDMQRALYQKPKEDSRDVSVDMVVLPHIDGSDDVRCAPSLTAAQETLRCLFRQAQGMASLQRFDFASMSQILLHNFETFSEVSYLYEEEIADMDSRSLVVMAFRTPCLSWNRVKNAVRQKVKASLLSTFGFFLDLKTHQTFWRAMELTAETFVQHVERFNQNIDGDAVLTNAAKDSLLEWMAHVFWSLQHAQFRLHVLWSIQHEVYNRGDYPFYPYVREALEDGSDVHVIIIKLCKAELHDLGSIPPLLKELQEASKHVEQMDFVNRGMMDGIDEFSTRFRVLQVLYYAAQLVVPEDKIKAALVAYPFNPEGAEIHSKEDDVTELMTAVHHGSTRASPPRNPSFLQKLIMEENAYRQQHSETMYHIHPIFDDSNVFTRQMFDAFKRTFTMLLRNQIEPQWKNYERSLLPYPLMKRVQHRREVEKKKRVSKDISSRVSEVADEPAQDMTAVARERKSVDASLFWEVGDGSLEPYVPPVIREKIKTRKEGGDGKIEDLNTEDEGPQVPDVSPQPRSLNQLKHSDFETRDVLWGKRKGCLKWSCLLQLLTRIGCKILNLDGSKKKVVDVHTGLSTVLHMPHPGDTCRTYQRILYCTHVKEHLKIRYQDLVMADEQVEVLPKA